MKTFFWLLSIFFIINNALLYSKSPITIKSQYPIDSCHQEPRIWFMDLNNDDRFDACLIRNCFGTMTSLNLSERTSFNLNSNMIAIYVSGSIKTKNFIFKIYNPEIEKFISRLYYDNNLSSAILEDYTDNGNEPSSYEEADNYFYTQQMGSTLLITKKAHIDVQSVMLCSLDGRVIANLQNVEGWSQFSFDMSLEPSGMYLVRFIARDKALTKRVVYIR